MYEIQEDSSIRKNKEWKLGVRQTTHKTIPMGFLLLVKVRKDLERVTPRCKYLPHIPPPTNPAEREPSDIYEMGENVWKIKMSIKRRADEGYRKCHQRPRNSLVTSDATLREVGELLPASRPSCHLLGLPSTTLGQDLMASHLQQASTPHLTQLSLHYTSLSYRYRPHTGLPQQTQLT